MHYCCMFEIMTIKMYKLVLKISGIVNRQPSNRLNSYAVQCFLSVAETKWRSNHELALLCLSRYSNRYVTMVAPSGCLRGRKGCDAINGCPQTGASIDSLLLVTGRISCFSHVIIVIVSTTF